MKAQIIALALAAAMTGCSPSSGGELLAEADSAFQSGDYDRARSLCDEALKAGSLSATDAARVSVMLIKVSDKIHDDDGEAVGQAVRAYDMAMETQPDSAMAYYADVDAEDTRHVKMLLNLVRGLELPDSALLEDEEELYIPDLD
ncbi:MAG: hypothetical protein NC187_06155 [Candidatus Amulumruptor caecigallinarius]|nr:hypothetical protein [Candidatus Amulumruptor caecigallinarius]MCM1397053.1 hypothetical protein [Candidatus Amulumruptor caecigallinarius]MCM1454001.1 hypothetical protein [bacterium]